MTGLASGSEIWQSGQVVVYGFAVFSGAFLLFQIQPLLGKYLLPWFGGAPAVWTACLLMFQVLLVAGYAYAYLSSKWLKPRAQVALHLLLLLVAIALPIVPGASWRPTDAADPTLRICWLLTACVGLPFVVLSATAPLLQHWFSLVQTKTSPFRLYTLSNAGSQLALLSYPVFFETCFGRTTQVLLWRAGLGILLVSCAWAGIPVWNTAGRSGPRARPGKVPAPMPGDKALWVLLPACGSLLLVAVTNKLCQDVAPIPLLWVLPLSVYLLSFILSFNGSGIYDRRWFAPLLFVGLGMMAWLLSGQAVLSAQAQVVVFLCGLFICCLVCHGEVFRVRPDPVQLPAFYLMLSAGGALGGAFAAVIAPRIFSDYFELPMGLMLCASLFVLACGRRQYSKLRDRWRGVVLGAGATALACLALVFWVVSHQNDRMRVYRSRNFYGVLNVYRHESPDAAGGLMELVHGRIVHGVQFLDPGRAPTPTLYYSPESGVGRAFASLTSESSRRIGAVGLGVGTIAAYLRPADRLTFYEINPEVEKVAERFFSFLKSRGGQVEVVPGDARLSLEAQPAQNFDLLVLDAFNGDSIPIHLLTREAFAVYQRHTRPDGMIAVHISNQSLNLEPVVLNLARKSGYAAQVIQQPFSNEGEGILPSTWIVLSQNPGVIKALAPESTARTPEPGSLQGPLWTDEDNGLFPVIRWRREVSAVSAMSAHLSAQASDGPARNARVMLAIDRFRKELAANPNSSVALNNLACLLATAGDPALRNGPEAVTLAEKACSLTQYRNASALSTLAAAYAETGRFEEAIAISEKACALASEEGQAGLLTGNRQMLQYFRQGRAYHQASP